MTMMIDTTRTVRSQTGIFTSDGFSAPVQSAKTPGVGKDFGGDFGGGVGEDFNGDLGAREDGDFGSGFRRNFKGRFRCGRQWEVTEIFEWGFRRRGVWRLR